MIRSDARLKLDWRKADSFISAVFCQDRVAGLTHDFYKYPARFSPQFCKAALEAFSDIGDLVVDPFAGGGTTLVESRVSGRLSIGTDVSTLASFVSRVKTRIYSGVDLSYVENWFKDIDDNLGIRRKVPRESWWSESGYQRNLGTKQTWPIRKSLELALVRAKRIRDARRREFVRCVLLRTAQWALDGRRNIPSASEFRSMLPVVAARMVHGAQEYSARARVADRVAGATSVRRSVALNRKAEDLAKFLQDNGRPPPNLILTSPPYAGVHVLYHRWQVHGGRETPAPFWVANQLDGSGESHYLMNARSHDLSRYFSGISKAFSASRKFAHKRTVAVQMVAFSDPEKQLPLYLAAMSESGFEECLFSDHLDSKDGRLWRDVPGRKWHANTKGDLGSSKEVVLVHKPR